jgi:hypothetical protein
MTATKPLATVHVDLDGARHIYAAHGWAYDRASDPLFDTGLRNTLDFLDEFGIKATLFVIAEDLDDPARAAMLQGAIRRGHEIASHTMTHRKLTDLSPSEMQHEIVGSRTKIADTLGVTPAGFRAPGFAVNRAALDMVGEAGYAYDSSLFPTKRTAARLGLGDVSAWPGQLLDGHPLVELPLPPQGLMPLPFHPSYSLIVGTWYFRLGLRNAYASRAPLVVLFHLTDLAEPLSAAGALDPRKRLWTISHLSGASKRRRCHAMMTAVGRRYTVVSTSSLLASGGEAALNSKQEKAHT